MSDNRIIVFGVDGACLDLVEPWIREGELPTLERLMDEGSSSTLTSTVPASTPPAWTSLTTGVNPGKHGIFGFYERQRGSYDVAPVSDRSSHSRRLWDYLTEEGLTSLVVNVPVTHPARDMDGALIPGYMAPDEPSTHPEDLLPDVGLPGYKVYAESESRDVPEARMLEEWLDLTESRRDAALRLMERYDDWDLLFVEFQKTDGAVHKFRDEENVRAVFERVDTCMQEVLDAAPEDPNVFVVSDHGIGQEKEWSIALNTWLVENGYAEMTRGRVDDSSWVEEAKGEERSGRESIPGSALKLVSRFGLTKQRAERVLSAVGLYDAAARLLPEGTGSGLEQEVLDRASSLAFYEGMGFSGVDVGVVLNHERFYDEGEVREEEYHDLREELMEDLRSLTGPDGGRVFDSVRPREEVYSGDRVEYAPDIVLEQSDRYVIGSSNLRGKTFSATEDGRIDHTREGILIAAGPDVDTDWSPEEAPRVEDVTPTLLRLLGTPLAEEFDGEALNDLIEAEGVAETKRYGPFRAQDGGEQTDEEREALERRLKDMGYLG